MYDVRGGAVYELRPGFRTGGKTDKMVIDLFQKLEHASDDSHRSRQEETGTGEAADSSGGSSQG